MYSVQEINDKKTWEDFVTAAAPHTFLHSWQWSEFNAATGHPIFRYGVYSNSVLVAVALIIHTKARRGKFLFCPHGPVIANELEAAEIFAALTQTLKEKAQMLGCSFIRISPTLLANPKNNDLFLNLGYKESPIHMAHPELAWILDLTINEDELLKHMRKSTRYSIKKAEKDGVVITKSTSAEDIERFWQVYQTTFTRQHFTPFSKEYLKKEFEIFAGEGKAVFFFAEYQGATTSTALILFDAHGGYYHHGASTQQFSGLTDAQLLQWEVIKEAKRRGCTHYNFWGVVPETATKHPWSGLSTFKRGFGGSQEQYVHAKDLVLSPLYYLTYIIEKVRKMKRGL